MADKYYVSFGHFDSCTSLTKVELCGNVTRIPMEMFAHCTALKSITIPEGVRVIGQ